MEFLQCNFCACFPHNKSKRMCFSIIFKNNFLLYRMLSDCKKYKRFNIFTKGTLENPSSAVLANCRWALGNVNKFLHLKWVYLYCKCHCKVILFFKYNVYWILLIIMDPYDQFPYHITLLYIFIFICKIGFYFFCPYLDEICPLWCDQCMMSSVQLWVPHSDHV